MKKYQPDEVLLVVEQNGTPSVRYGGCTAGCGACCEYLVVPLDPVIKTVDPALYKDYAYWLSLHGLLLYVDGSQLSLKIPIPCSKLETDEDGDKICGVYGTDERPDLCSRFPRTVMGIRGVEDICTYRWRAIKPSEDATHVQRQYAAEQEARGDEPPLPRQPSLQ